MRPKILSYTKYTNSEDYFNKNLVHAVRGKYSDLFAPAVSRISKTNFASRRLCGGYSELEYIVFVGVVPSVVNRAK
jgi:hypothetical protein